MSTTKTKAFPSETIEATEDAAAKGFGATKAAVEESIGRVTKGLESSQTKLKENMEKMMKSSEEMMAFGQANIEAFMKASKILASGFQDITKDVASSHRSSLDHTVAFTKSLLGVKSVKEAVDLQASFARDAIEKAVMETNKMADATIKLTEQALAPITARMTAAAERFGKLV
jgi:phasin family protein